MEENRNVSYSYRSFLILTTALLDSGPDEGPSWDRRGQLLHHRSNYHWWLVHWQQKNSHDLLLLYLHTGRKVKILLNYI